ncbi:MAG: FAD-binding oxidoreductase, partial [Thermodesulfobacteriota bacterium]
EGTLGFVVEATIQLTSQPKESSAILIGLEDINNSIKVLDLFREKLILNAFEFFSNSAVKHVVLKLGKNIPVCDTLPYYLLVEVETPTDKELESASEIYVHAFDSGLIEDGVISQNPAQYRELWMFRENITEAISIFLTYKNDISVRTSQIPEFVNEINSILNKEYPDFDTILFGHIGDGNIHVSILKPHDFEKERFLNMCREVNTKIFETVAKYGGSISAEHGVGLIKRPYLKYTISEAEIDLMKGIKKVFDPNGIMNPAKIFSN